jgi:hypothetical protein
MNSHCSIGKNLLDTYEFSRFTNFQIRSRGKNHKKNYKELNRALC